MQSESTIIDLFEYMNRITKYLSRIIILMMITSLGFAACGVMDEPDEPIGIWPPIEWVNVNHLAQDNGVYLLNEIGGSVSFECTNYTSPWFSLVVTVDSTNYLISDEEVISDEARKHFKKEWVEIKLDGNKLFIIADPLPASSEPRTVSFYVTVGDTGTGFTFRQQKKS